MDMNATVNQVGFLIKIDIGTNITSATDVKILFKKPSGATGEWAGFKMYDTIVARATGEADLDEIGDYELQAKAKTPSFTISGQKISMIVEKPKKVKA